MKSVCRFLLLALSLAATASAGLLPSTELFVAASAHAVGGNNSFFATDVRVFNPGAATANVSISWLPAGTDNSAATTVAHSVAPGETLALDDIVDSLFAASGAGGLRFVSDQPIAVTSRTYNRTESGTFAQFIPARAVFEALSAGARGSILGLSKSSGWRTNVGFLNVRPGFAAIHLTLRDSAGAELGSTDVGLPPYGFTQLDPFLGVGSTGGENVRVDLSITGGVALAYGSVIDQSTNDPNFVEPVTSWPGDGTWSAGTAVAVTSTRTFRSHLELTVAGGTLDRIDSWDQLYDGQKADGTGCTALVDLSTLEGRGVPIAGDGSFTASFSGSSANVTLSGTIAADGSGSGSFTASVTAGGCTGSFGGTWSGRRK